MIVILTVAGVTPSMAKDADSTEPGSAHNETGYNRGTVYASIDGQDINAFNFNFVAQFPLAVGLSYPENAGLNLQLNLTYNSRVAYWHKSDTHRKFLRSRRQNPFGLGFDLTLGRIVAGDPAITNDGRAYVDSSGATHKLYLVTGSTTDWRTHDGSHIRAVQTGDVFTVSFPNGVVQELGYQISSPILRDLTDCHSPCDPAEAGDIACPSPVVVPDNPTALGTGVDRDFVGWHVTKVYSRAAVNGASFPSYTVEYYGQSSPGTSYPYVIKSITDQFGRTVNFHMNASGLVDQIATPAPSTESGASRVATYDLEYEERSSGGRDAWYLRKLSGPDVSSSGGTQRYVHLFDYRTADGTVSNGQLSSVRYPSGILVQLSYVEYPYLNGDIGWCNGSFESRGDPDECNLGHQNGGTCHHSWGVSKIDKYLDGDPGHDTTDNHLVTTLSQTTRVRDWKSAGAGECGNYSPPQPSGYFRFDQVHTMVDPAKNATEFVYRTPKEPNEENWYGLLVSELYYGVQPSGTKKLLKQLDYDYEQVDAGVHEYEMLPRTITTTWTDDTDEAGNPLAVPTTMVEERSNFDGFGHYQRAEFSGTAVGSEPKIVIKDYASDNVVGSSCSTADTLRSNWLGDVVAYEEVQRRYLGIPYTVSHVDYGYDLVRGLRTRAVTRRGNYGNQGYYQSCDNEPDPTISGGTGNPGDRMTEYTFTSSGDLASEQTTLYGGTSVGSPSQVGTSYTYNYGTRASTKQDAFTYYDSLRTIDPASGLVVSDRANVTSVSDSAGVNTTFAYDVMGRTVKVQHGTDDALNLSYENEPEVTPWPAPIGSAVRLARVRSTQGTSYWQTESVDHFVSGRLSKEEKLNPDSSRAYRYTSYNTAGRVSFQSEWTRNTTASGVPGTATSYAITDASEAVLFEDPFARPTRITDPLGGVTTTRYFGTNKEVTVQGVALKGGPLEDPANVRNWYYSDGLGRLRVVLKPAIVGGNGPYDQAAAGGKYTYDAQGRLTKAEISGSVTVTPTATDRYAASVTAAQTSEFTYDYLGRLLMSETPESGLITYKAWNALGAATTSQNPMQETWDDTRRTTYDGVGRPILEERVQPYSFDHSYAAGNGTWTMSGWRYDSTGTCHPQGVTGAPAWYIGDTSCQYGVSASTGPLTLDSPSIILGRRGYLTFKYFREVRDEVGYGGHDRLSVKVQDHATSVWTTVFSIDSSQVSWKKWTQSPAIPLEAFAGKTVTVRFEFDSVNQAGVTGLKGVGISQVALRRPDSTTLREIVYDEPFACGNSKARGKATTIKEYDEATSGPIFTRQLHYCDDNARLSDEILSLDWDRDGVNQTLVDSYGYDSRGDLLNQRLPHVDGDNAHTRQYNYSRWHGSLVGISATNVGTGAVQTFIPADSADGIQYNDAGGMSLVKFGNGLRQHIDANDDFLPSRIWVAQGESTSPLWDTGQYLYDGARNIKQIGSGNYYRYDRAMRLTWSRDSSGIYNTVDLDPDYDEFGNMKSQSATRSGGGTNELPYGLTFSGRTFVDNKLSNSGFGHDLNGNLVAEPAHDNLPSQGYVFTPENQLSAVTSGALPGAAVQAAMYEGGDHRWFRSIWGDGSKALITLRDASGQVVADFLESNAASGLQLQREYVHANGQLVAINSACGPRPALALSNPHTTGTTVWFDKIDYVTPTGSYTMHVRSNDGQTKTITLPASVGNHFSIGQNELFPNVQNWIQIEGQAECGPTGYSNAVSYTYDPSSPSCLRSNGGGRDHFNGSGSKLWVTGLGSCAPTTTYNIYYVDPDVEATELVPLNGSTPVADPSQTLDNIPCGSGNGNYWIRPVNPVTHHEMAGSPVITMDGTSCGGGMDASSTFTPGMPGMNVQFVHWDHLGSTRLVTDEHGVQVAAFKYYPFGYEAEFTGGGDLRQKFTGHERDEAAGLDYMMARSCRMSLARFIQPDEYAGSARPALPQSWNRYAYVRNNPIGAVDPTGYAEQITPAPGGNASSKSLDEIQSPSGNNQPDNSVKMYGDYVNGSSGAVVVEYGVHGGAEAEVKVGVIEGKVGITGGVTTAKDLGTGETSVTHEIEIGGDLKVAAGEFNLTSEAHVVRSVNGEPVQGAAHVDTGPEVGFTRSSGSASLSDGPTVRVAFTVGILRIALGSNLGALVTTMAKSPIVMMNLVAGQGVVTTSDVVNQQRSTASP